MPKPPSRRSSRTHEHRPPDELLASSVLDAPTARRRVEPREPSPFPAPVEPLAPCFSRRSLSLAQIPAGTRGQPPCHGGRRREYPKVDTTNEHVTETSTIGPGSRSSIPTGCRRRMRLHYLVRAKAALPTSLRPPNTSARDALTPIKHPPPPPQNSIGAPVPSAYCTCPDSIFYTNCLLSVLSDAPM